MLGWRKGCASWPTRWAPRLRGPAVEGGVSQGAQRGDVAAEAATDVVGAGATGGGEAGVERGREKVGGESRPNLQRMGGREAGRPRLRPMARRKMGTEVLILQRRMA